MGAPTTEIVAAMRTIGYWTAKDISQELCIPATTILGWMNKDPKVSTMRNGRFQFVSRADVDRRVRVLADNQARTAKARSARHAEPGVKAVDDVSAPETSVSLGQVWDQLAALTRIVTRIAQDLGVRVD